jgi:hypothetical protein
MQLWKKSSRMDRAFDIQCHSRNSPEAESKEKHVVWDPMPELTITSPYVHSRVDSNTFTMANSMPESTLSPQSGTLNFESGFNLSILRHSEM